MSDDEEYKKKRERNNKSVQKCRENEKKKVQEAKVLLEQHKKENKELEAKCGNLEKELQVLKSLFRGPPDNEEAKEETPKSSNEQVSLSQDKLTNKTELNKPKIYLNEAVSAKAASNSSQSDDLKSKNSKKNSLDFDLIGNNHNDLNNNNESGNKRFKKIELPKHHEYSLRRKFGN